VIWAVATPRKFTKENNMINKYEAADDSMVLLLYYEVDAYLPR
jgi:hypothetical protein